MIRLGNTDLKVSRLCYGTEPFTIKKGPDGEKAQGDKTPEEGGRILADAVKLGVNFWDTSDDYGTHPHVAHGLTLVKRSDVVIADKTNALTEEDGWDAIEYSLKSLGTDYVDLMFLHNLLPESMHRNDAIGRPFYSGNLEERKGAMRAFHDAKETGQVKAVALSTHSTTVLREAAKVHEIDVVCTTLNIAGLFMDHGISEEHLDAIRGLKEAGKGVYVIKLLGAGRLRDSADEALRFAFGFHDFIDAWNIGMYDLDDVRKNLALLSEYVSD